MLTVAVLIVCQSSLGKLISWYTARSTLRNGVWFIWFTSRGLANVWSPGHWERSTRPLHRRNLYRKGKVNASFYVIYVDSALKQWPSLACTHLFVWPYLVLCHIKGDIRLLPGVSILISSVHAMAGESPAVSQHPEGRVEVSLQKAMYATQFWVSSVSLLAFTPSLLLYFLKGNERNFISSKQSFGDTKSYQVFFSSHKHTHP